MTAKNPDDSLELMCASPYMLPILYISITTVMSLIDIMSICFPLLAGKTLHMHSRIMLAHICICQHPHQSNPTILIATHEPTHQFHILISEPVTLSPRYFGVPSYWSLQFIKIEWHNITANSKTMYR